MYNRVTYYCGVLLYLTLHYQLGTCHFLPPLSHLVTKNTRVGRFELSMCFTPMFHVGDHESNMYRNKLQSNFCEKMFWYGGKV